MDDVLKGKDYAMIKEENRLKSFKNWPFKDGKCTKENMAKAGFYHCNLRGEADAVRCFSCFKELDGWEKTDDPWIEHQKHNNNCHFIELFKPTNDLSLKEFISVIREREVTLLNMQFDRRIQEVRELTLQYGLEK